MDELILDFLAKYPIFTNFIFIVGMLRVINKPLFSLLRTYVNYTPSQSDDALLDKIEQSKAYKTVTYLLDWLVSVKIKK